LNHEDQDRLRDVFGGKKREERHDCGRDTNGERGEGGRVSDKIAVSLRPKHPVCHKKDIKSG
jgi:hypothetical protein